MVAAKDCAMAMPQIQGLIRKEGGELCEHASPPMYDKYLIAMLMARKRCSIVYREDNYLGLLFPGEVIGWQNLNKCIACLCSRPAATVQLHSSDSTLTVALSISKH